MNRFLPSKKLLIPLATILVILGCFFLFSKLKNNEVSYLTNATNQEETTKIINKEIQQTLKNDTDEDGLKDWEEALWKTDPNNPDSDGDGTDDNSEVLTNRNPLVAGPDDSLDNKVIVNNNKQNNSELGKTLTQTDIISRELFAGYVALKQNDQLGTVQEEQFINDLVTKNLSGQTSHLKEYEISDLDIIQDNSQGALQQHADQLKRISDLGNELEDDATTANIIRIALETRDQQELRKLNSIIEIYREMQNQLIILEVPSIISINQINIINAISNLIKDTKDILSIFDDPVSGMIGLQNYSDDTAIIQKEVNKIMESYAEKNIKF